MKHLCDRVEILETRETGGVKYEICASIIATYNDVMEELAVTLDSFVRKVNPRGVALELRPGWLPRGDTVKHPFTFEEAIEEVGVIAKSWTRRIRESIPGLEAFGAAVAESHQLSVKGE